MKAIKKLLAKILSQQAYLRTLHRAFYFLFDFKLLRGDARFKYHYMVRKIIQPDFVVDISDFIAKKEASILAYSSQFYSEKSNEPVTPIATKNFLESIHNRTQEFGRLVGVDYAEGFTVERYVAVNSLSDLK